RPGGSELCRDVRRRRCGVRGLALVALAGLRGVGGGYRVGRRRWRHEFGIDLLACKARRLELRERVVAAPHRFVIDAFGRASRVRLVDLDRFFLEWKRLLLEQHVVLLTLFRRELTRTLRVEQRLAEVPVQL